MLKSFRLPTVRRGPLATELHAEVQVEHIPESDSLMLIWTGAYAYRWTELVETLDPVALVDRACSRFQAKWQDDPVKVAEEDFRSLD